VESPQTFSTVVNFTGEAPEKATDMRHTYATLREELFARVFLLELQTLMNWMRRLDEQGEHGLIQTTEPVNKYPPAKGAFWGGVKSGKDQGPEVL
jgi:hypothetical protein